MNLLCERPRQVGVALRAHRTLYFSLLTGHRTVILVKWLGD